MNTRLSLQATGDELITLAKEDLQVAIKRFMTARPPQKKDPALMGGEQVAVCLGQGRAACVATSRAGV